MRAVVGAAGGDVDRDVADQPHAALGGVGAQRAPLALEADLVGDARPRAPANALPVARSRTRSRSRNACSLGAPTRGARGVGQQPGQAANAERGLYGER